MKILKKKQKAIILIAFLGMVMFTFFVNTITNVFATSDSAIYELEKNTNASDEIMPESRYMYFGLNDLDIYTDAELTVGRNEIYARHGYIFKNNALQKYFESKSWYTPEVSAEDFDESSLNPTERANAQFIKLYQEGNYKYSSAKALENETPTKSTTKASTTAITTAVTTEVTTASATTTEATTATQQTTTSNEDDGTSKIIMATIVILIVFIAIVVIVSLIFIIKKLNNSNIK